MELRGLLRELVDEQDYPRLYRIAWSDDINEDSSGFEERQEFLFGLDRILDGVAALIGNRTEQAGRRSTTRCSVPSSARRPNRRHSSTTRWQAGS